MAHWKGAAARARALKEQLLAVLRELEADTDVSHAAGALTESARRASDWLARGCPPLRNEPGQRHFFKELTMVAFVNPSSITNGVSLHVAIGYTSLDGRAHVPRTRRRVRVHAHPRGESGYRVPVRVPGGRHPAAHQVVSRERAGRVQVGCGGGDCVSVCARVRVGESGTWCSCTARGERHRLS